MIDLHSHLLPGVDDGSRDVQESLALLDMLAEQGIETVAATPHFYANHESVDAFLARRQAAYERLAGSLAAKHPCILLGAEVRYYEGISRLPKLKKLCIGDSQLLLLEMSMEKWTEYTVRELLELSRMGDLTIVLAHIERYWKQQRIDVWQALLENEILMQVNASFFLNFATRRKAFGLLKEQAIHFIGSDCHNVSDRPPRIGKALDLICKKMGQDFAEALYNYDKKKLAI